MVVVSDHGFQALTATDEGRFFAPRTERLREWLTERVGPVEVSKLGHKLVVTVTDAEAGDVDAVERALADLTQSSTAAPFYRWERIPEDPRSLGLTLRDEDVTPARLRTDTVGDEPLEHFVKLTEAFSGVHARDGVFIANGPSIASGLEIPPLSLLDVTPILLAVTGLPPAQDYEGEVPWELFARDPRLPASPESYDDLAARRRLVGGEDGVNEAQLRALGYIE